MWSVIEIVITPQALIFHDFLETFVTDIHAAARPVTIIRYNGKTVAYEFASGSFLGMPTGAQARFPSRLRMFDSGGNRYTHTTIGKPGSNRWEQTTVNMLGQTVEVEKPAFGTGTHLTENSHDDAGRLARVSQPGKADTIFEYDAAGNLHRTGFKAGGTGTQLAPASSDRIMESTIIYAKENGDWFQVQSTSVYAADASGTPTEVETVKERLSGFGANVLQQVFRYDIHGNETIETVTVDRSAKLTTFATAVPGSNIPATRIVRNGLLQEENSSTLAAATKYVYDAFGRRIKSIDPRIGATETAYRQFTVDDVDFTGSLVAATEDPAGNITAFTYHDSGPGAGMISMREDPDGKKTWFSYNARGQQVRTWGATYPVEYEYDADFGHLINQHTFRGGSGWFGPTWPSSPGTKDTTIWHYDEATGLLEAKEYADETETQYTYHPSGELATRTWARLVGGQPLVTTYTYWEDAGGELKKVDYSDSTPDVEYTYTRTGQWETITDAAGTRTFGYTNYLELETEEIDGTSGGLYSFVITRKYEGTGTGEVAGRASGVSVGDSLNPAADYDTTWRYDSAGRFSRVQGPGLPSYGAEYGYVANGRRVETISYKTNSSTAVASSTYTPLANRNHVETVENAGGAVTISKYHYVYDDAGQRVSVENSGTAFAASAHNMFDYNDRGEVTKSERFGGTVSSPGTEIIPQRRAYEFDPIGNRESHAEGGGASVLYHTNGLNQYTERGVEEEEEFSYDADGNLIGITGIEEGGGSFQWDGENRLRWTNIGEEGPMYREYLYDYQGRRVAATYYLHEDEEEEPEILWQEKYIWDDWNLLLILDDNDNVLRRFTWGLDIAEQATGLPPGTRPGTAAGGVGGLIGVEEETGDNSGSFAYFYDANGNIGQVFDWSGVAVAAHYEYDPFGGLVSSSGAYASENRFRFSTKYFDPGTNLYYYGHRYYSPAMGRWLNRDPINEMGFDSVKSMRLGNGSILENEEPVLGWKVISGKLATLTHREINRLRTLVDSVSELNEIEEQNLHRFALNNGINQFDRFGLSCDDNTCGAPEDCCQKGYNKCMGNCPRWWKPTSLITCWKKCRMDRVECFGDHYGEDGDIPW